MLNSDVYHVTCLIRQFLSLLCPHNKSRYSLLLFSTIDQAWRCSIPKLKSDEAYAGANTSDLAKILEKLTILPETVDRNSRRQKASDVRLASLSTVMNDNNATIADVNKHSQGMINSSRHRNVPTRSIAEADADDWTGDSFRSLTEESDENFDVSTQYLAIKDSVNKSILPDHLVLGESGPPAKGEARCSLTIVRKASTFVATIFKLLKTFARKPIEEQLEIIYTVALVLQKYLQSEHSAAIVEGTGVPKETTT